MDEPVTTTQILFLTFAALFNLLVFGGFLWGIFKAFRWTHDLYRRQHAFMDRAEAHFEAMEEMQARLLEHLAATGPPSASSDPAQGAMGGPAEEPPTDDSAPN